MALIRWNPGTELMNLHSEMDRLFEELAGDMGDLRDRRTHRDCPARKAVRAPEDPRSDQPEQRIRAESLAELAENIQREDLNPLERVRALQRCASVSERRRGRRWDRAVGVIRQLEAHQARPYEPLCDGGSRPGRDGAAAWPGARVSRVHTAQKAA